MIRVPILGFMMPKSQVGRRPQDSFHPYVLMAALLIAPSEGVREAICLVVKIHESQCTENRY